MTERIDPIRRRPRSGPPRRETIEELYGDVIAPHSSGLFDAAPDRDPSPAAASAGGASSPREGEGAPGGFSRHGAFAYPAKAGDLTAVTLSHGVGTLASLGLWRFWQKTAQRRSIWAHTRLAGEPFEYVGTGLEMFLGAMVVVVFLGAMVLTSNLALVWFGLAATFSDLFSLSSVSIGLAAALALMALPLLQYARFRARRYRLRRTRWRSIRFDMRGSGLAMVGRWLAWAPAVAGTLGLALPFQRVALERHMTDSAMWGRSRFFFRGSAWRLMPLWLAVWVLLAAPLSMGAAHAWRGFEEAAAGGAAKTEPAPGEAPGTPARPEAPAAPMIDTPAADPAPQGPMTQARAAASHVADTLRPWRDRLIGAGAGLIGMGPGAWVALPLVWTGALALLTLSYRAAEIRLFVNARRIEGVRARCTFGPDALLAAMLAVAGRMIWPGLLVGISIGAAVLVPLASAGATDVRADGWRAGGLVAMAFILSYGGGALFSMWLTDVVWFRAIHHRLCKAITVEGLETLDHVRQRARAPGAEAEGLADAFDVDAGF